VAPEPRDGLLAVEQPRQQTPPSQFVLFALGFRPLFLLAGWSAVVLIGVWLLLFTREPALNSYYGTHLWHAHELTFGYTAAVIGGFLLTAVRNWTDTPTLNGPPLAGLALIWLAGRLLPFFPQVIPGPLIALVDLAFLVLLAVAIAIPIWRKGSRQNLLFIPILLLLDLANGMVHLQALQVTSASGLTGVRLGIYLILLLITILGGRVIPFFTERALSVTTRQRPTVERLAFVTLILLALAELWYPQPQLLMVLAALATVVHAMRLAGWYAPGIWREPLLWVLHLGYAWLVIGMAIRGLAAADLIMPSLTWHAYTVGAIGVLTLGMMARVALGHTGRPMRAHRSVAVAFGLVNLAAALRVLAPAVFPQWYLTWITSSGWCWIAAFGIFALVYTPILVRPRADGRPG